MGVIKEFSPDEFWKTEDKYLKMIGRMKERAKEIAVEFGKVDDGWSVKDIDETEHANLLL